MKYEKYDRSFKRFVFRANSGYNSLCLLSSDLYNFHDQQMAGEAECGGGTIMWKETTAVILTFGECHKFEISGILFLSVFKCVLITNVSYQNHKTTTYRLSGWKKAGSSA